MKLRSLARFGVFFMSFASIAWAGPTPVEKDCIEQATTIDEKLGCIEGLKIVEVNHGPDLPNGMRQFRLKFTQPIDHENPAAGSFDQLVVLLHRNEAEPMVLQTSGYSIFGVRLSTLAQTFGTNQIQVEHRFFAESKPEVLDWSKLNIKQSADDFHEITQHFRQIYKGKWVNTGASKGGMTSVFHRRFYPDDLDGTVADVAPLSYSKADERYITFVDNVGGDLYKDCRQKWRDLQVKLLERRDAIVPEIVGSYDILGSADVAFEHTVIEASFVFWQYKSPTDPVIGCDKIDLEASDSDLHKYLEAVSPVSTYGDGDISDFMPYFFQAATELGGPGAGMDHINSLRKYDCDLLQYIPQGVHHSYSNEAMIDVQNWVLNDAKNMMFVYGEFDPWTAGQYEVRATDEGETYKYFVPAGNHGSKFTMLADADKDKAMTTLSKWFNKSPVEAKAGKLKFATLDELEATEKARRRLP